MQYISALESVFWSERFWLPNNITWATFQDHNDAAKVGAGIRHPQPRELLIAIPLAILMFLLRHIVEKFIMKPIAVLIGIKRTKPRTPENIPQLHDFYLKSSRRPSYGEIKQLASQLDMQERQVERWFRLQRNLNKSSVMTKFCEGGWKFTFHCSAFCFGLYVLHDEDFFYDTGLIRTTWPHQHIKTEFYTYYMVILAYWTSMLMTLLSDVRRHDFHMMSLHHVLTCLLMVISWSVNFTQVGMLVLITHDFADLFLEICKMAKHAKKENLSNVFFVLFFLSWSASRLYYYPRHIVYVCWETYVDYYHETGQHVPVGFCLVSFLTLLFCLHVIWTFMILRLLYELIFMKEWVDHRSDSEAEQSSDSISNGHSNGRRPNGVNQSGDMNGDAKKVQ